MSGSIAASCRRGWSAAAGTASSSPVWTCSFRSHPRYGCRQRTAKGGAAPGRASYWRDWPVEPRTLFGGGNWYEPGGEELAGGPYLLATASLRFAVPSGDLPEPHLDGAGVAGGPRGLAGGGRGLH